MWLSKVLASAVTTDRMLSQATVIYSRAYLIVCHAIYAWKAHSCLPQDIYHVIVSEC